MNYTVMTRARRHGIYFDRHELAPLGIDEGTKCWGLWVEGRQFDKNSRLVTSEDLLKNESPQLAVSSIHPTHWAGAFNVEALLARRLIKGDESASACDAVLGFSDALSRCGVNVLMVRTAQIGYNLLSFSATCELPRLRPVIMDLLAEADAAGRKLDAFRRECEDLNQDDRDARLECQDKECYRRRAAAFQALGLILVPRLAELEARLVVMNDHRYDYATVVDAESRKALIMSAAHNPLQAPAVDARYAAIVGKLPSQSLTPENREQELSIALAAPWFFNEKVLTAGENTYFLSYRSIQDSQKNSSAWPKHLPTPEVASDTEFTPDVAHALFEELYEHQRERSLNRELEEVIPESPYRMQGLNVAVRRSATSERVLRDSGNAEEFMLGAQLDFMRQQALRPVSITALPSLAHMRFWAFGGAVNRGSPLELRYERHLLKPVADGVDGKRRLASLFEFLSDTTQVESDGAYGQFGPHMCVIGNLNIHDRFIRLRFVRELLETEKYVTATLKYTIEHFSSGTLADGHGLMRRFAELIVSEGFRIEQVANSIDESNESVEQGRITLSGRAITPDGQRCCSKIAHLDIPPGRTTFRVLLATRWKERLESLSGSGPVVKIIDLHLQVGLVAPDR